MRLSTTMKTAVRKVEKIEFDWGNNPYPSAGTTVCCPQIVSAKLNRFVSCPNSNCRKKIVVKNGDDKTVQCQYCHRVMLMKKCILSSNFEIVIEKDSRQTKLTAFEECVKSYFIASGFVKDLNVYTTSILEMENVDVTFDKKKIITKLFDHNDLI